MNFFNPISLNTAKLNAVPRGNARTKGFTLIELVVVLVILGLLASFALPRFSDLSENAAVAQAEGVAGALSSSINIVRTVYISQGISGRIQNLQGFGDNTVDVNDNGYPIGTNKGNGNNNIGRGNQGCVSVWSAILDGGGPSVSLNTGDDIEYQAFRRPNNQSCTYVFRGNGDTAGFATAQIAILYDSTAGTVRACGQSTLLPNC